MNAVELNRILKLHKEYLTSGGITGMRANLRGANLHGANLRGINLREADLRGADLCGANLCEADLHRANLRGANLCGVNLCGANLYRANLRGADLCGADLYRADLYRANLREADLYRANLREANLCGASNISLNAYPLSCPEEGGFIGFKKAYHGINNTPLLVKLNILPDSKRLSATTRKCRCDKAEVISITSIDGQEQYETARSGHDINFIYKIGEIVTVDDFDENRWNECAPGIHFFITREEAVNY